VNYSRALLRGMRDVDTLSGPGSVAAIEELREMREKKTEWPYPWCFPPPGAIRVTAGADSSGTLAVPAAATPTQALLYTVDQGFVFALESLVVTYLNAGKLGAWSPGDASWTLDVSRPVGVTTFQGYDVQGLTNVDIPLGTLQIPWPLVKAELFKPNDALRIVFTNTNLSQGNPNFIKAMLLGWRWPVR